jgi:hypothetical protein
MTTSVSVDYDSIDVVINAKIHSLRLYYEDFISTVALRTKPKVLSTPTDCPFPKTHFTHTNLISLLSILEEVMEV